MAEICWQVWGTPSKFQQVSRLVFIAAATLLSGDQPNFARCLAISWTGTLYIYIFRGSCPINEFASCKNSLCVHHLHSSILATLLHGTWVMWASVKVCSVVQGIESRNFHRGRHLYSAGQPSCWASANILVMAARSNGQTIIFLFCDFFYLLLSIFYLFFLAYSQ